MELFSEEDDRCAYEFIKQVEPLHGLMETEAYTVLTEELLTNTVRRKIPPHVKTTSQVYRFLIEEFGGASSTLETWVPPFLLLLLFSSSPPPFLYYATLSKESP